MKTGSHHIGYKIWAFWHLDLGSWPQYGGGVYSCDVGGISKACPNGQCSCDLNQFDPLFQQM